MRSIGKWTLPVILLLAILCCYAPWAGTLEKFTADVRTEGNVVIVTGATTPETFVSLLVTRESDGDKRYADQARSDKKGDYSFEFEMNSGDYAATVVSNGIPRQRDFRILEAYKASVAVRVEGAEYTLLPGTEVDILHGETTLSRAVKDALNQKGVSYEMSGDIIESIAGESGWQYIVNNRAGMTVPDAPIHKGDEIVLVDAQIWDPVITRLTVSQDRVKVGEEFTITLKALDGTSASPAPSEPVVFDGAEKITDAEGKITFTAAKEGSYEVICQPASAKLIRPEPVLMTVSKESDSGAAPGEEITVYVTVKGYKDKTVLKNYRVKTGIFDLEPYLNDGTGSSADPSNDWYADKFTRPVVAHAMVKALEENRIKYDFQDYGWGLYFAMIDGNREFDYTASSGWMYTKNGRGATGVQAEAIKDGDEIYFWFSTSGWEDPADIEDPFKQYGDTINNPQAGEEEVLEAVDEMAKALDNLAGDLKTEDEAKQAAGNAGKAADIIGQGLSKVNSPAGLHKIADNITKIAKTLENIAGKMQSGEGKKEVADSTQKVVDTALQALNRMQDQAKIDAVANKILESTGNVAAITGKETAAELIKKAVQVAEKVVAKAGTEKLSAGDTQTVGNKTTATADPARLTARAEKTTQKAQAMEQKLADNNLPATRTLERKIVLEIPGTGATAVETGLPAGTLDGMAAKGISKVEIKTHVASFKLTPDTFGEKAQGQHIVLSARKVSNAKLPAGARPQIPANSQVVDLTAQIGREVANSFAKPVEVSIPYTLKENDDPAQITVFLLKEDGSVKPVGGQYNPATGTVKFITSHFSQYFAKQSTKQFTDLEEHRWAKDIVAIMAGKGIIAGRTNTQFDPGASISRAEFIALAARMLKFEAAGAARPPFKNINQDKWYHVPVTAAWENGLLKGQPLDRFDLEKPITRQEMAVIIAAVLENKGYKPADPAQLQAFADRDNIAPWAARPVALATREGLIKGMGDNQFAPLENANRAQAAVMLYRLYTLFME
ncbi:MAG: S-layer homology domain-containing protein [Firmicutes bacterium]|nr:S-layer homology domain-containing protein [Bacillota bacterium]